MFLSLDCCLGKGSCTTLAGFTVRPGPIVAPHNITVNDLYSHMLSNTHVTKKKIMQIAKAKLLMNLRRDIFLFFTKNKNDLLHCQVIHYLQVHQVLPKKKKTFSDSQIYIF